MGLGGSEATAAWVLQALQDDYEVTLSTSADVDWDRLNTVYGTSLRPDSIRFRQGPRYPGVNGPDKLVYFQRKVFEKFCHGIGGEYDLCISAYNPIDFGCPGLQLIGDFSFSEKMRKLLYVHGDTGFVHRESFLRRSYLKVSDWMGIPERPLGERGDLVLANSRWAVDQLAEHFGVENSPVIYPPVVLPDAKPGLEREPLGFACLGRIVPEKEVDRIIRILDAVRVRGFPVKLELIGEIGEDAYGQKVSDMVRSRTDWVTAHGFLHLDRKQDLLSRQSFALHACSIEAFGIAVAEMASLGCVPFVPATGGATEIVTLPELQYHAEDEAVEKIVAVLENPGRAEELRFQLAEDVSTFGPRHFMEDLREHVTSFFRRDESAARPSNAPGTKMLLPAD